MKSVLLAASIVSLTLAAAHVADAAEPLAPFDPVVDPAIFSWTGGYVGVQIGYGWAEVDRDSIAGFAYSFSADGGLAGVHVGYNHQWNRLVLGIEGDVEWAGGRGDDGGAGGTLDTVDLNWDASVRARVGIAFNRVLVYGTGGVALADVDQINPSGLPVRSSAMFTGWTAGAGAEFAFADNWTARLEYRYSDFGSERFIAAGLAPFTFDIDMHAVRLGVSYKF